MADDFNQSQANARYDLRMSSVRAMGDRIFKEIINYYPNYPTSHEEEQNQRKGTLQELYKVESMIKTEIGYLESALR